jgi:hypothetical protein
MKLDIASVMTPCFFVSFVFMVLPFGVSHLVKETQAYMLLSVYCVRTLATPPQR